MTLREEVERLLLDWEDGCLDRSGRARLRHLIATQTEAREVYLQHQFLNAAFHLSEDSPPSASDGQPNAADQRLATDIRPDDGQSQRDETPWQKTASDSDQTTAPKRSHRRSPGWLWVSVALLLTVTARLLFVELTDLASDVNTDPSAEIIPLKEETAYGVAQVTELVGGSLQSSQVVLRPGDAISPGRISLSDGVAQIEFFCGATLVLEGPAQMDVKSPLLAEVLSGQLRAQVPPAARGFSLVVNDLKVVDLGTEFALAVRDGRTDVQVFDGEVEIHSEQKDLQKLSAGQGVSIDANGDTVSAAVAPDRFVDVAQMQTRVQSRNAARFERWRKWSHSVRQDARLLVYYTFQDQHSGRRLLNQQQSATGELDGAIVGAERAVGRWPEKRALDFKRPGDRVRLQVPGEFESLTFAAWVRIDSLDKPFNSLFLTDNYNRGEPHWQILADGRLYFSVRPSERGHPGPRDHKVLSPPFWKPSLSGQWIHLATTYDIDRQQVTHYLNGQGIHSETIPADRLVKSTRLGTASLGNWSLPTLPTAEFAIRNLNGSMDEFLLFAAALTTKEIRDIYEHGRP